MLRAAVPGVAPLCVALLGIALVGAGCGEKGPRPSGTGADRVRAVHDSLLAVRDARLYEVAWLRSELRAARDKKPYLVLDFDKNLLTMKVGGAAFDSLLLGGHDLELPDADTLGLGSLHRILAAEVLAARPAKLDVDTTVNKAAAILARMIPPRPKPLRFVIHSEDMSVRFTAGDVRSPWEDIKLFVQRSWGAPPDSIAAHPRARLDVVIEAEDLTRIEHFVDRQMPLLLRFPPRERERILRHDAEHRD
jgi:hypothetical protein